MTPRTVSTLSTFSLLAIVATALPGCGGSNGTPGNNALAPQFQPQVVNNTDDFQFQATGMTGVTQTLDYAWRNTGVQANVNQSCSLTGGTATLVLTDSTGA